MALRLLTLVALVSFASGAIAQPFYPPQPGYPGYAPGYSPGYAPGYGGGYPPGGGYAVVPIPSHGSNGYYRRGTQPYAVVPIAPPDPSGLPYSFSAAVPPPMAVKRPSDTTENGAAFNHISNKRVREALTQEQRALRELEASRRILRRELGEEAVSANTDATTPPNQ